MLSKFFYSSETPSAPTRLNHVSVSLVTALFLISLWVTLLTQIDLFKEQERFSEFYIKDTASLLKTNSLDLAQNEEASFVVGVVNHEGTISTYRTHILINGHLVSMGDNISLEDNESLEEPIKISFPIVGDNQCIDIFLEKQGAPFPYRSLHILANVSTAK